MKANLHALYSAIALIGMPSLFAQRSVTIPAQSSSSVEESATESPESRPSPPVAPLSSPFNGSSSVSRVAVPTQSVGVGEVSSQATRVPDETPTGTVTAMERVEIVPPPLDVATIKRLAELQRELNVAESATKARVTLPANEIFAENSATVIDHLSKPVLLKVVEYLSLTLKKEVTIKGYFAPYSEGGEAEAWARSLALLKWIAANSELEGDNLKVVAPEILRKETAKQFATGIGDTEFVPVIVINLE